MLSYISTWGFLSTREVREATITSQTVMSCNLTLTFLSVVSNHLDSYFISPSVTANVSPKNEHLYSKPISSTKRPWNLATRRKTLVCGCQAILLRPNKWLNRARKATNSSDLCVELLGVSLAPKRVAHCIFLLSSAISVYATQIWSVQSTGLLNELKTCSGVQQINLALPFRCDVTYNNRHQLTHLLRISHWHEFLEIVFFYKAANNLVFIYSELLCL